MSTSDVPDLTSAHLFDVRDKTVLVTGGSSGLGKAMAAAFVQGGARVYIASRKLPQLEAVSSELNALGLASGGTCSHFVADIKDKRGCDALAAQLSAKESKLSVLINNSGMAWGGPLENFPEKDGWDRVMGTNVKSIFYLTAALVPLLSKGVNNIDPARVINITSIFGTYPIVEMALAKPGWGTYSYATSKAAANHLTRILAASLARKHITVNAIAPGVFPTLMSRHGVENNLESLLADQPTGRMGTSEDIAGLALFLASRAGSHVTGTVIPIDGGAILGVEKAKAKL